MYSVSWQRPKSRVDPPPFDGLGSAGGHPSDRDGRFEPASRRIISVAAELVHSYEYFAYLGHRY